MRDWLRDELARQLVDAQDERDRARDQCVHLEAALDEALEELAEVRDQLAEMRRRALRVVGP